MSPWKHWGKASSAWVSQDVSELETIYNCSVSGLYFMQCPPTPRLQANACSLNYPMQHTLCEIAGEKEPSRSCPSSAEGPPPAKLKQEPQPSLCLGFFARDRQETRSGDGSHRRAEENAHAAFFFLRVFRFLFFWLFFFFFFFLCFCCVASQQHKGDTQRHHQRHHSSRLRRARTSRLVLVVINVEDGKRQSGRRVLAVNHRDDVVAERGLDLGAGDTLSLASGAFGESCEGC